MAHLVLLLVLAALAPGCAFDEHRAGLAHLHAVGGYDTAEKMLDDPGVVELYGDSDRLLWLLDRGAVAFARGDDTRTLGALEEAEHIMDLAHGQTAGGTIAQWALNDMAAPYVGEPYEDIYVNVLKLLAQLRSGHLQGGATVEARRAAGKANLLRDRYVRSQRGVNDKGGSGFASASERGAMVSREHAGEFIESPLGTFLTAVTFMKTGEAENQRVAGRRLLDSIEKQGGLIGPVNAADFKGLDELRPESANLLIVGLSGRGPLKAPQTIGPIPVFTWPVYFQLPVLIPQPTEVAAVRVVVQAQATPDAPAESAAGGAGVTQDLALVEDLSAVAVENHRRQLPLIYARALLRASVKSGLSFAASETIRRSGQPSSGRDAAVFGSVLLGMAALAITERADLRTWVFLPGQARVALMRLEPGTYRVRVEYLGAAGGVVYAGPVREVKVGGSPRDLTTIVEHYWR